VSGKVSGVTNTQPASGVTRSSGQRTQSAPSPSAGGSAAADSVQITDTASHLINAEQSLGDVPVVSKGRVAEITDALAAGTYKISPERIANQLLHFERQLPANLAE
jgi:negative regulator of flagellin synthesis FlgM